MKKFSKSSGDIKVYLDRWLEREPKKFEFQQYNRSFLLDQEDRARCVLCKNEKLVPAFTVINVSYKACMHCNHVQTSKLPPVHYPLVSNDLFADIYAQDSDAAYE